MAQKLKQRLEVGQLDIPLGSKLEGASSTLAPFYPSGAVQSLTDAGAANVTSYMTKLTTTGAAAVTLANGVQIGQMKHIQLIVDGGDATLTITGNPTATDTVTFADAGDMVLLQWDGENWLVLETNNLADGATAPVVA